MRRIFADIFRATASLMLAVSLSNQAYANVLELQPQLQLNPFPGIVLYEQPLITPPLPGNQIAPPQVLPYLYLPPINFPLPPDPSLNQLPWAGIFDPFDPLNLSDPLFAFNLQVQMPTPNEFVLSDGSESLFFDGLQVDPGITCLQQEGCGPITFILPHLIEPSGQLSVNAGLNLTDIFFYDAGTNLPTNQISVEIGFFDPNPQLFFDPNIEPLFGGRAFDPLNPFQFLPGLDPFLFDPNLPPIMDPLGSQSGILPIPPDPTGLELHTQSLVVAGVRIDGLEANQRIGIGESLHLTVNEIPEPATLVLLGLALGWLSIRRRRCCAAG